MKSGRIIRRTDNGGPPLEDNHVPEWGRRGIGNYFDWRRAHRRSWRRASPDVVRFRDDKAEKLGLTYAEYTLEILEFGRHLQKGDRQRITRIKRHRPKPRRAD
jgi:hypothetical protein